MTADDTPLPQGDDSVMRHLAVNIVQRARLLAALDPVVLASSGLDLAVLDYEIEDITTALARRGLIPNEGLFVPEEEPDGERMDRALSASLARGLADNAAGRTVDLGDFTRYIDEVDEKPDVDEGVPRLRATDDPDYDEAERQEVERTGVLPGDETADLLKEVLTRIDGQVAALTDEHVEARLDELFLRAGVPRSKDPRDILSEIAERQGWNVDAQLGLALAYIRNHDSTETFEDFLAAIAAAENEEGI